MLEILASHSLCEFMHHLYTHLHCTDPRLPFCRWQYGSIYLFNFTQPAPEGSIIWQISALHSYKVVEIGSNRKPVCRFLLVFHCNYLLSFPSYNNLLVKNLSFSPFLPTSVLFETIDWGVPLGLRYEIWS